MSVVTYEAVVEDGHIKLPPGVRLPSQTKVYVVVPAEDPGTGPARIVSPRFVRREDAPAFRLEVSEARLDDPV